MLNLDDGELEVVEIVLRMASSNCDVAERDEACPVADTYACLFLRRKCDELIARIVQHKDDMEAEKNDV